MSRKIFVNLPVADLPAAMAFYSAIGFTNNPQFTDETAAGMVWSDDIYVMLLTHEKWQSFTSRPLPPAGASEVMLAISVDSIDEVHELNRLAEENGGKADVNPPEEYSFMFSRHFADPDGHVWSPFWMDLDAAG